MAKIFYIMGKSAAGKDCVFREMRNYFPQLKNIILYTTRPRRRGEVDGEDYYFVSEEERDAMLADGKIIESRSYDTIHGDWHYFTADDGQFDENYDYIGIGTLTSYLALEGHLSHFSLIPIYVEVEDGERLQRAINREKKQREPKYLELCRRYIADQDDFSEANLQNAGITKRFVNDFRERCGSEIRDFIQSQLDE